MREDAVDERRHLQLVARDQVEERLQVPLLGPADVAGRVVNAVELVPGVVPARPVGPGEPDVEFLLVVGVPRQVELHLADVDDPGAVAGQLHGRLDRAVAVAAGGQEHVVRAAAAGDLGELGEHGVQVVRRPGRHGAGLLRQPAALGHRVDADRLHAGRREQPDHQLADQAEADDGGGLAELHLGAAHALHRDGGHGGERGVLGQHPGGDSRAQVDRHPVVLGVQRLLVAGAGDELADLELLRALANLGDDAAQRVAERGVGVELVHHLLVGGDKPLLLHLVNHLLDLVRPGAGHAHHRHAGLGDLHHLGTGRDEREQRPHQDAAGAADRGGHVEDGQLTRLVVLGYLLHQVPQGFSDQSTCSTALHRDACGAHLAVPELHRQQLPDLLGVVFPARLLVGDELQQGLLAQQPELHQLAADEDVAD